MPRHPRRTGGTRKPGPTSLLTVTHVGVCVRTLFSLPSTRTFRPKAPLATVRPLRSVPQTPAPRGPSQLGWVGRECGTSHTRPDETRPHDRPYVDGSPAPDTEALAAHTLRHRTTEGPSPDTGSTHRPGTPRAVRVTPHIRRTDRPPIRSLPDVSTVIAGGNGFGSTTERWPQRNDGHNGTAGQCTVTTPTIRVRPDESRRRRQTGPGLDPSPVKERFEEGPGERRTNWSCLTRRESPAPSSREECTLGRRLRRGPPPPSLSPDPRHGRTPAPTSGDVHLRNRTHTRPCLGPSGYGCIVRPLLRQSSTDSLPGRLRYESIRTLWAPG